MEVFADDNCDILHQTVGRTRCWFRWLGPVIRFRVISAIRFQRRFGFVEQRKDVKPMASGISCSFEPAAMIAQVPAINPWMIGNNYVTKFLARQPFVRVPDPRRAVVKVEHKTALCQKAEFPWLVRFASCQPKLHWYLRRLACPPFSIESKLSKTSLMFLFDVTTTHWIEAFS